MPPERGSGPSSRQSHHVCSEQQSSKHTAAEPRIQVTAAEPNAPLSSEGEASREAAKTQLSPPGGFLCGPDRESHAGSLNGELILSGGVQSELMRLAGPLLRGALRALPGLTCCLRGLRTAARTPRACACDSSACPQAPGMLGCTQPYFPFNFSL